ncbi:hypothetical protein BDN70DRAFT_138739 [Pholiota conissans]|uniref:Uncharacterized protein n=1 Tax=Pholiota conissans TaxID=109636 RepID=A0A9P6CRD1_9AGAR|nr:hypothetical protein BDN70DRAFT_138739 [Pholiota conissans]
MNFSRKDDKEVPLVSANLATVCIESLLYGIFLILFVLSTYLLATRKLTSEKTPKGKSLTSLALRNPLIVSSLLIAVTITAHWILTCLRLFQAFVLFQNGTQPLDFYADLTQRTEVVKTGFLMASLVLGDAMIIYRLWIVWGYDKRVVIFPLCTLAGLSVCGVGITYQFTQYKPGENVFLSVAGRWITSDAVFTLCTNVYSTAAISWKIWRINKNAQKFGSRSLMSALGIVVESAFVYTVWTTFFFASYQSESNLQFIAVDCWPAMSGIAFMLINVRVGLGWAQKNMSSAGNTMQSVRSGNPRTFNGDEYPLHPVAINIQQAVHTDADHKYDYTVNKVYQSSNTAGV